MDSDHREENLDPQDWENLRRLGHQMLDDALDTLETVRERPVWHPFGRGDAFLDQPHRGSEGTWASRISALCPAASHGRITRAFGAGMDNGICGFVDMQLLNPNMGRPCGELCGLR
jgi:hypothetical protein